ncbi:ribonuclease H-like domain-containing protein [Tanacetum coccineum]
MELQSETTQTVSALKLPVLKTMDYDLWNMRMEQYLTHTDYALWEVIVNGDAPAIASASTEGHIPPKTVEQKLARKNELKAKSTMLLAIPDEHLLKSEGLDKIYDRFQKLISQLEIHGEDIYQEDANLKLLRSLPSAWNNIALIMRNKSDLDTLSMDDLYNNLKVYEAEIKGQSSSSSSSNSQNVAFVSSENTSSTNKAVNTAYDVSTVSSKGQASSSTYADDIDTDDLKKMDLKWQVAMLTIRVKRFINKIGRNPKFNGKETVGFVKTKVQCYNRHKRGHFARECRAPRNQGNRNGDNTRRVVPVETPANALVVTDGMGYDWNYQAEEGPTYFALMAHTSSGSSSSSSSDTEREVLNKANLEIIGYQIGLESLEARIVVHEKNEAVYEENIVFLKYDVQVKDISVKDLKNQLEEALKEKDDLRLKLKKIEESDEDDNPVNDRFKIGEGFHTVPPPYTGNYMPPIPDLSFVGLDDSVFKFKVSKTITSKDSLKKSKTVRSSAPLIKDCESDSDDDCVIRSSADQSKPKYTKINFFKSGENVKFVNKENTHRQAEYLKKSQSPRSNRENLNEKVNTARFNNVTTAGPKAVVSAAEGNRENVVKSSACWIWRPTGNVIDHISKDSGSYMLKIFDYVDPQGRLKLLYNMMELVLALSYQDIDGGFVAFAFDSCEFLEDNLSHRKCFGNGRDCQMDFIQLGRISRVDEMIFGRVLSDFGRREVWETNRVLVLVLAGDGKKLYKLRL